jgi:hypothetical protein
MDAECTCLPERTSSPLSFRTLFCASVIEFGGLLSRNPVLFLAILTGCATVAPAPSSDTEQKRLEQAVDERGNARIPVTRQATEEELAEAFEAPAPPPTPPQGQTEAPAALDAGTADPPEVDIAALKADFARSEKQLERLVASKQKDPGVESALAELEQAAVPLGPPYPARVLRLRVMRARAMGDAATAAALAARWLNECGPDSVGRCRAQALAAIDRAVAAKEPAPARWKQLAKDAREADVCLKEAEAAAASKANDAPECLPRAQQFYARTGDRLMGARALFADGRIRLASQPSGERAFGRLEEAARRCEEPRCFEVRRRVLRFLTNLYLAKGEAALAARAALRDVDVNASSLPPARRMYAWTPEATRACAAYDARAGAGACRALEQKIRGSYAFKDFSLERSRGEGLPQDAVREVNAHYGVTLQECLTGEAKRLQPPAEERYTVRWIVRNDGRVSEVVLDRRESNDGPLARCMRSQMAVWRYPRYEGELQHVEQSFLVTAR